MKRSTLALVGGTVVWAAIGVVRRNRRPPRDTPLFRSHRAVVVATLLWPDITTMAFGWDGAGFISSAWGFLSGIPGDIKEWVLIAINFAVEKLGNAIELVTDGLQWGLDQFSAGVTTVVGQIADVTRAVGGVIEETRAQVEGAFSNFRQQLTGFLENAWDDLKDWVIDNFPDWIGDLFGDLWDILQGLAGIGWDGLTFLLDLIDDPIGFLWALLKDTVESAIDAALGGIGFGAELFEQIVRIGLGIIFDGYGDVIDVLQKIWHILEWLAAHVDDFTIDVLEGIINTSWQTIQSDVVEAVDDSIGGFESLVKKLFGLNGEPVTLGPIVGPQGP